MLKPRYFFFGDFRPFYEYFLSQPHKKRIFQKGEHLWEPGSPYGNLYYIVSGTAVHGADHESGHRKIISFHGPGMLRQSAFCQKKPNKSKVSAILEEK